MAVAMFRAPHEGLAYVLAYVQNCLRAVLGDMLGTEVGFIVPSSPWRMSARPRPG
ncbi:hypothetical protein [Streptomyces sp. NBC_00140]|uniref:hypothetical protein n=1 Tax=Streptomyces sp. NBC_00140 TaxID=2975664 RepID=UPI002256EC83|nr:hypothetical protein [Streptomyces sp. NBC_00140]MCX5329647.1 hypothetical protein [Streptomyces sp. NBC_00140]